MRVTVERARSPQALATVGVAILAVVVRLPSVYSQPFWQDEVASARILGAPTFPAMLERVARTESTPPLWYSLAWMLHAAGAPLRDVRLLSVVAGGILAAVTVVLARRFMTLPFAVAAGVLVALGSQYVARGEELRAYELFALFSVLFALCLAAELQAPALRRELGLAAVVAAGCLTHYFFVFTVLAALLWLHIDPRARRVAGRARLAILGGCLGAAAWVPVALEQIHRNRFSWIGPFQLRSVLAVPLRLFTPFYNDTMPGRVLSSLAAIALVLSAIGLLRLSAEGALAVSCALLPIAIAAATWAAGIHIFAVRNLVAVGPFAAVVVVYGVSRLPRLPAAATAVCLCLALGASLAWSRANGFPRFDAIAHNLVRDGWKPSDPIAVFGRAAVYRSPLEWYLPRRPLLVAARAPRRACGDLFLVSPNGRVRFLASGEHGQSLRRATLLVDPNSHGSCARELERVEQRGRRVTAAGPVAVEGR